MGKKYIFLDIMLGIKFKVFLVVVVSVLMVLSTLGLVYASGTGSGSAGTA